jgi:hypothetical protein
LEILNEIEQIGWEKLESVNSNFTELKFKMFDSSDRQHILYVKLSSGVPEFITDYPKPFTHRVCCLIAVTIFLSY